MDATRTAPLLLIFALGCQATGASAQKKPPSTSLKIVAAAAVEITSIGRGTEAMKTWTGESYVEKDGKTQAVPQYAKAVPSKPEHAKHLTFQIEMPIDSDVWRLAATDCVLRPKAVGSAQGWRALGIISPSLQNDLRSWDGTPKESYKGPVEYATTRLSPGAATAETLYEEVGVPSSFKAARVRFWLAFPEAVPDTGELLLDLGGLAAPR